MSTWRAPLLEQARSDFEAAEVLSRYEGCASQTTMLLQMAWEKLAKAALVMSGRWDPKERIHNVAARFVSVLKRAPRVEDVFRPVSRNALAAQLTQLQDDLLALQALTPALAKGENAEYPWEARDAAGVIVVRWPALHLTRRFSSPSGRGGVRVRKDFAVIASHFDRLFR